MFSKLLIVIPTRNRPALAKMALDSVLSQQSCAEVEVILSDNSTNSCYDDLKLDQYEIKGPKDGPVFRYIRPDNSLSMTAHWEWAYQKISTDCSGSHVLYLTDRMFFHSGYLKELVKILRDHPMEVVTYCYDRIYDDESPIKMMRLPRTGSLYGVPSRWLLGKASNMSFPMCLPRMLNCVVPVKKFREIGEKFENVFGSVSPDFNFCFKVLATQERILFYDKALMINYGHNLSNGASTSRGIKSSTNLDFAQLQGAQEINSLTPFPSVMTVGNAIVHEYLYVSNCHAGRFLPKISHEKYLEMLTSEVAMFEDGEVKREAISLLKEHGVRMDLISVKRHLTNLVRAFLLKVLKKRAHNLEDALAFMKQRKARTYSALHIIDRRYGDFLIKTKLS
jgi:glycosyltransferase involved in cell wall biosynthesis